MLKNREFERHRVLYGAEGSGMHEQLADYARRVGLCGADEPGLLHQLADFY